MKKKVAISSIVLALFTVLVAGTVPHHHHGDDAVCLFTAHCEDDPAPGDPHAGHNPHAGHHSANCIAEANYYFSPENKTKINAPSCDGCDDPGHAHFFHLLCLIPDFLTYPPHNTCTKPKQGEYIPLLYAFAGANRLHGLRAPPFILS